MVTSCLLETEKHLKAGEDGSEDVCGKLWPATFIKETQVALFQRKPRGWEAGWREACSKFSHGTVCGQSEKAKQGNKSVMPH